MELRIRTQHSLHDLESNRSKPVVILFGWMLAKTKHMNKYGDVYLSKGFDVLNIKMLPSQVLWPKNAQPVTQNILDFLENDRCKDRPILVHGFSVGGYLYGELLVKLQLMPERYAHVRSRMIGQIFDSPVDVEGIPTGFSQILTKNRLLQSILFSSITLYMKLFKEQATKYFMRSSAAFHENELNIPSMMLYSKTDPIGVASTIEKVIANWRKKNIPVYSKCWHNSPHVSHFHHHPDEYIEALFMFLDKIRIPEEVKRRKSSTAH